MAPWKQRTLVALTTCLLTACSTSRQASDEGAPGEPRPFALDTSEWPEERRALEADFHAWLSEYAPLDAALRQGVSNFHSVIQRRSTGQTALDTRLRNYLKGSSDPELNAWGSMRLAQTYLNFACEVEDITAPPGLTAEQDRAFRDSIDAMAADLFTKTIATLNAVTEQGVDAWSDKAEYLRLHLEPPTSASCETTSAYWRP
ncbi:hypothetical protein FRC96_04575 [Lujinxingia vulgaris]|uniref:Uncharacterized protein n=1 Tax=Lujinxingia vulgaris TaxID=2600176 RepID=A0A5C6XKG7_9DELT|nr:hypothetical protein [Lujinxingia vulgaris]TXD41265.1 hypothetical protein FRC96_04575 [Lujinxingia vulgaris]